MTPEQLARYSRHITIPEVGKVGQTKLLQSRVLIIGLGGLGCPASLYLAAAGVGRLGLVDFDSISVSNLHRQILYNASQIGQLKVDAAAKRLTALNPDLAIEKYPVRLSSDNAKEIIQNYDYVIDGTDNFATRYLVNDACVLFNKLNVYGSIYRWEGQSTIFCAKDGPCYRCLFPEPPAPGHIPSCNQGGVMGVLPGIIGLIQATETIKLIIGKGDTLIGRVWVFDMLSMKQSEFKLEKNTDCPACGRSPTITDLIDYEQFCAGNKDSEDRSTLSCDGSYGEIAASDLKILLDENSDLLLLDIREPFEHEISRIRNSRLIPLSELEDRITEINSYREVDVIVYCHHGIRSAHAASYLRTAGFNKVRHLKGGIDNWSRSVDTSVARY